MFSTAASQPLQTRRPDDESRAQSFCIGPPFGSANVPIADPSATEASPLTEAITSSTLTTPAILSEPSSGSSVNLNLVENNAQHPSPVPTTPSTSECSQTPITIHSPFASFPIFSLEHQIVLMLEGEYITFDLDALEADTTVIIDLLKLTASERGAWMMVAAYYRRKGLPRSSIQVMKTLLHVLEPFKVPEAELKPIYLLLSGCETDLAKNAKARGHDPSGHYRNAQQYLFQVYGDAKAKNQARHRSPTPVQVAHGSRRTDDEKKSATDAKASLMHRRILEQEVQCLHDKNVELDQRLSDMRVAKRKLRNALDDERMDRRQIERALNDAEKERDMAKRMETHVLEQIKREVEGRRRAEDNAEKERLRRREMERATSRRDPSAFLEGLAILCHRAAAGEAVPLPGVAALPARPRNQDGNLLLPGNTSLAHSGV